jgi:hypothetical protein
MKIEKLKTIGFSIAVFLLPFLFMVIVNETIALKKKEKGYRINTIEAINSNKADANKCTWICHNNTLYCKEHHTKMIQPFFKYTDPIYFGTIQLLMATGNYGAANILLYVVFFPLTIGVLMIWNRQLTIKMATLKKYKNGNN